MFRSREDLPTVRTLSKKSAAADAYMDAYEETTLAVWLEKKATDETIDLYREAMSAVLFVKLDMNFPNMSNEKN